MAEKPQSYTSNSKAFTLLEVMITISILVSLVIAVSQIMKQGFDLRSYLSKSAETTQKMNIMLETLNRDLSHSFIIYSKDSVRTNTRKTRTYFEIGKGSESDYLKMTYMAHTAIKGNAKESDISFVFYELQDDPKISGQKNLYRGEFARVPKNFKEKPPMKVIAKDIASINFFAWNGDSWSRSRWNSTSSDTKDKMPQMVRVIIKSWDAKREDRTEDSIADVIYSTVVYLPNALEFDEIKSRTTSFKIN